MSSSIISGVVCALGLTSAVTAVKIGDSAEKQFSQAFPEGYSILKFHGGYGPYSERRSYGISRDPPESCAVDQVIMIKRHGERYPSPSMGDDIETSLAKVYGAGVTEWKNDLAFLDDWEYFVPNKCWYNAETYSGPYAGLSDAYQQGTEYRDRYGDLWDGESVIPMFTSGYSRVINTARKFGEGFFGYNYSTTAALNIISESASMGANSLTPFCDTDNDITTCDKIPATMPQFKVAAARLNSQNSGLNLTESDIYNLMSMAVFELNARAYSEWINVFTQDEWVTYSYLNDLYYYYCAGPGDKNMAAVGAVYANASLSLLNEGPKKAGSLFFNLYALYPVPSTKWVNCGAPANWDSAHDTNITPIIAALGILIPDEDLPLDRIPFGNPYVATDIVPMGGHLTIERLSCNATAMSDEEIYVRLVLNEAVVPFNKCQSGPGYSCPLANYTAILKESLPNYLTSCKVPKSYPQSLDFWWNYNTTTRLNYQRGPISCQEAETLH